MSTSHVIGLTGGIASGKSYVGRCFANLGVPVIDADDVSRTVVTPPSPVLDAIAQRFGANMLRSDGQLDRPALRAVVFADTQARRELEAITHPAIRAAIRAWLAAQTAPYCILANAILLESGMEQLVDRVLVVDAHEAVQLRRLMQRDGMTADAAQRMLDAQMSRQQRLSRADDIIDNSDESLTPTPMIFRLHRAYTALGEARHQN